MQASPIDDDNITAITKVGCSFMLAMSNNKLQKTWLLILTKPGYHF